MNSLGRGGGGYCWELYIDIWDQTFDLHLAFLMMSLGVGEVRTLSNSGKSLEVSGDWKQTLASGESNYCLSVSSFSLTTSQPPAEAGGQLAGWQCIYIRGMHLVGAISLLDSLP